MPLDPLTAITPSWFITKNIGNSGRTKSSTTGKRKLFDQSKSDRYIRCAIIAKSLKIDPRRIHAFLHTDGIDVRNGYADRKQVFESLNKGGFNVDFIRQ